MKMFRPNTLLSVIGLARLQDEKLMTKKIQPKATFPKLAVTPTGNVPVAPLLAENLPPVKQLEISQHPEKTPRGGVNMCFPTNTTN